VRDIYYPPVYAISKANFYKQDCAVNCAVDKS
jgi:hypothetical protein